MDAVDLLIWSVAMRLTLDNMPWLTIAELWLDPLDADPFELDSELRGMIAEELEEQHELPLGGVFRVGEAPLIIRSGYALGHFADEHDNFQVSPARWGLIPFDSVSPHLGDQLSLLDVQAVTRRPILSRLVERQRCLILVDGYSTVEWSGRQRITHKFVLNPSEPVLLAGVWDTWIDDDASVEVLSCGLLTCAADEPLSRYHERAPLLVPCSRWRDWLDGTCAGESLIPELLPAGDSNLRHHVVQEVRRKKREGRHHAEAPVQLELISASERRCEPHTQLDLFGAAS